MTLPLLSNTVTYGLWWQETNQMIGILNNLTDGSLTVNGSLIFANSQFSLTAPSQNISNTLALTSPSGNSLFLLSSNAVINGTMFITGASPGLAVSNNANINQNLYVSVNSYAQNTTTYQTTISNNIVANVIAVNSKIITNNVVTNSLYVNSNATFVNVTTHNIAIIQAANVQQGLGVTGGLTADLANLNFITTNNTLQLYGAPSLNSVGAIHSTLLNGTGTAQFRAVEAQSGIIFRNDGNNFSILTTGNVATPYTATYNGLIPFQFNVQSGSLLIDGTGAGCTFNGPVTITGPVEHASNIAVSGFLQANGPGNGLYVANSSFLNGSAFANSSFTVGGNLFVNGNAFLNQQLTVTQAAIFQSLINGLGNLNINGTSNFSGGVTAQATIAAGGPITAANGTVGLVSPAGEIQSGGGAISGGQFRAVAGNFGVLARNDGSSFYLLQTPSTTTPYTTTWNSYRPFAWNLSTGAVSIDAGGSGVTFGGQIQVATNDIVFASPGQGLVFNNGGGTQIGNLIMDPNGADLDLSAISGVVNIFGGRLYACVVNFGFLNNVNPTGISPPQTGLTGLVVSNVVQANQFWAFSDERLKDNIEPIPQEKGLEFVTTAKPVTFMMKGAGTRAAGFIAQDELKRGFGDSITIMENKDLEETVDEDGFVSPAGVQLSKNYNSDIAYLTAFGKWAVKEIESLKARINELEGKL